MAEIEKNDYSLNITRYVSTAKPEPEKDLTRIYANLTAIDQRIAEAAETRDAYLRELGLPDV